MLCLSFPGMIVGVLVLASLCRMNEATARSHGEQWKTMENNNTFREGILEKVTMMYTEDSSNIVKGLDTYASYANASRPTTAPYNENQTMTQNHDLHAFEEIIAFDVCEPCRGASKYIIVIY